MPEPSEYPLHIERFKISPEIYIFRQYGSENEFAGKPNLNFRMIMKGDIFIYFTIYYTSRSAYIPDLLDRNIKVESLEEFEPKECIKLITEWIENKVI